MDSFVDPRICEGIHDPFLIQVNFKHLHMNFDIKRVYEGIIISLSDLAFYLYQRAFISSKFYFYLEVDSKTKV